MNHPGKADEHKAVALATVEELRERMRRKSQLKGRQVDARALMQVSELLQPSLDALNIAAHERRDLLIEHLHKLNDHYRCLHDDHLVALASLMRVPMAEVYEVASFYHHFEIVREGEVAPNPITVRVCSGLSCNISGNVDILKTVSALIGNNARVVHVPCIGRCEQAPAAVVHQHPVPFADADKIMKLVNAAAHEQPAAQLAVHFEPANFAERSVTPPSGFTLVSPPSLNYAGYINQGGYQLLSSIASRDVDAEQVIKVMEDSGLRGLGGAGFPAGRKWRIVRDQAATEERRATPSSSLPTGDGLPLGGPRGNKLMAVNIDEGEPGTFKDRTYLERDPHRFLEGMLIAAKVVGINACFIYLRDEYHGCRAILEQAIRDLQAKPPCDLPLIELRRGAGAYICGEESAMIESIEGKRGEPRMRPPYIAQVGLFGRPTLEHNFETLYWVRDIIVRGPQWFSGFGRHGRKGLRSFSVSGRVNHPGVKLAPAGITLQELVDEYCGGMLDGHTLYAYLPGGASGGILPARMSDIPLDFDTLQPHGCFIGSAAVIVLSNHDKARDAALNMMQFFEHESCGQCTPCRVGTSKAAKLMQAPVWDNATLEDLSNVMIDASICGLGQAAPNPIRCVQRYFPEEVSVSEHKS
jgi:formate dehydrogenase beta subunit